MLTEIGEYAEVQDISATTLKNLIYNGFVPLTQNLPVGDNIGETRGPNFEIIPLSVLKPSERIETEEEQKIDGLESLQSRGNTLSCACGRLIESSHRHLAEPVML